MSRVVDIRERVVRAPASMNLGGNDPWSRMLQREMAGMNRESHKSVRGLGVWLVVIVLLGIAACGAAVLL